MPKDRGEPPGRPRAAGLQREQQPCDAARARLLTLPLSPWQFQIGELANTLTSKLEFLGINRQSISNFHMLLLQTEVTKPSPLAPAFRPEADQILSAARAPRAGAA